MPLLLGPLPWVFLFWSRCNKASKKVCCWKQKPINAYNVRLGTKKFCNLASSIQHPPSMLVFFPKAALKSAVDKNINIPKAFNTYSSWRKLYTLLCLIKDPYGQSKRFSPMPMALQEFDLYFSGLYSPSHTSKINQMIGTSGLLVRHKRVLLWKPGKSWWRNKSPWRYVIQGPW